MVPREPSGLEALLHELTSCRGPEDQERALAFDASYADARRLEQVPLVHAIDEIEDLVGIARDQALRSREDRGLSGRDAEEYLGIANKVYTSAGVLYPDAYAALVFGAQAESEGADASPWDSAWFTDAEIDFPMPPDPQRRVHFERYTVSAPDYRQYLVHYVASCFRRPHDYVRGRPHAFADPLGALCAHPRSRTFEVRIPGRLRADASTLQAVFVRERRPGSPMHEELASWLRRLKDARINVTMLSGSSQLLAVRVRQWVLEQLGYCE